MAVPYRLTRWHRVLNQLVGLEEESWGNAQAEGLGGVGILDQLEFGGLLHRQVSGLGAFQDLIHMGGGAPAQGGKVRPILHEPVLVCKLHLASDRRQAARPRERRQPGPVLLEQRAFLRGSSAGLM